MNKKESAGWAIFKLKMVFFCFTCSVNCFMYFICSLESETDQSGDPEKEASDTEVCHCLTCR